MLKTERKRVLITVMTYPHPSRSHDEVVCTAGITEDGEWIRLYPIDYRYRPPDQRFRKYQWIEVDLEERGAKNDNRPESRKPLLDSIEVLGPPLSTANGWKERRQIIDRLPHLTLNELKGRHRADKTSLGIVRPTRILDLKVEPAEAEWKPEWQAIYDQVRLFDPPPKPLTKIPFRFRYEFECEDSDQPHLAMNEDWELGVLFLKEVDRLGSEEAAAESVRKKFFDEICAPERDTRFSWVPTSRTTPGSSWGRSGLRSGCSRVFSMISTRPSAC